MTDVHQELAEVNDELKQLDEQLFLLMARKQKLLKRKNRIEKTLSNPIQPLSQCWDKTDFPWSERLDGLRSSLFKVDNFRPLQLQAMNATLSNQDCIVIMPTGGGKSLCFQLPAFVSKGFTLVVSPLISLMEDQLMSLTQLGVSQASFLSASSTAGQVKELQESMTTPGSLRILYVTPEKLAKSKRFMNRLEKAYGLGLFSRLVIDEVHCCSQWGHDFRPDYKFLGVMKRQFPNVPILGLTATATQDVIDDVMKILAIPKALVFRAPLNRKNLFYEVYPKPANMQDAVNEIHALISSRFINQSGIVYCLTQKDTEDVARELCKRGLKAGYYHANMDASSRSRVHADWSSNRLQVVVATIAFGMGIDKPDVRFVIHHSISKSLDSYYQESGRAGRDDGQAYCIMYVNFADIFRQSTMVFTEQTGLEKLYAMVAYAFDLASCRRKLIARHFNEHWTIVECQGMCDHCSQRDKVVAKQHDVTKYAKDLVAILQNARLRDQRLTGLKLIEAWLGKGSPSLRLSQHVAPAGMIRAEAERVIVHLLLNGYLREDFHFTPYSTISYLLPGEMVDVLNSDQHRMSMQLRVLSVDKDISSPAATGVTSHSEQTLCNPDKRNQNLKRKSKSKAETKSNRKQPRNSDDEETSSTIHDASVNKDCHAQPVIILDDDNNE